MGVFTEYLDQKFSSAELAEERKRQLNRISTLRGNCAILTYAADFTKAAARVPISIDYSDIRYIADQLANLRGDHLDLILETPGGSGEVAEDLVRMIRVRFTHLGIIIPGWAKSAGTIMAMAGDEILMGPESALGPIDAQLSWQGKSFSADALLRGFEKIKKAVEASGQLNKAYIPMLQGISPGDLESAQIAMDFAKTLVTDWLARYKFRTWTAHKNGQLVTDDHKRARAEEIAGQLCDHGRWKTHGRSIKLDDLAALRLKVTNYSDAPELGDAIRRYHALVMRTFDGTAYKLYETPTSQLYRNVVPQTTAPPAQADRAIIKVPCTNCRTVSQVQANLKPGLTLARGCANFPSDNMFTCPTCGQVIDLTQARHEIETQAGRPIVT